MTTASPCHLPVLLCFSHLRWDFVFQRPQHLLTRAARTHRVIYWQEPDYWSGRAPGLHRQVTPDGIVLLTPLLDWSEDELRRDAAQRALLDAFLAETPPVAVAWFYTPMAMAFAAHLRAAVTVYDCMDQLSAFAHAAPRLPLLERRLLRAADLVFTGGRSLHAAKRQLHARAQCFPSAVDVRHFARARVAGGADPAAQAAIPRPRAGFFGVIDERLDRDLLAALADLRPDWQFVMLGPLAKLGEADLPRRTNIHWLGPVAYADLPDYLAHWDAGIMPFAINEATRHISPTKTPEFLAAGLPVISTPIADVVADWGVPGHVGIASTALAFAAALDASPDPAARARTDRALGSMSWDATWAAMLALVRPPGRLPISKSVPHYDWLVVSAGFAGAVLAERLASQRHARVLVIDKRPHIAGNAFDHPDAAGILVHRYGPHIFHTNAPAVVDYLSAFTAWRPYEHRVLAQVDGRLLPIPINLDTVNRLYGLELDEAGLTAWFARQAEQVDVIRTSEDVVVSRVGRDLYEKFFRGYTRKQWGLDPSELDRAVTARVPIRTNRDDRYFADAFQAMPRDGFAKMFARMLDHPNITLQLGQSFGALRDIRFDRTVWTGPVDEYFGHAHGRLPYRSLRFVHTTLPIPWHQPVGVVNYPQTEAFTRVTEYKHLTGQQHEHTSISHEYPSDDGDPYYPVPTPANAALYRRYRAMADATPNVWFAGRLATYQYMNMDQVVAQALAVFGRIDAALPIAHPAAPGAGPARAMANEAD